MALLTLTSLSLLPLPCNPSTLTVHSSGDEHSDIASADTRGIANPLQTGSSGNEKREKGDGAGTSSTYITTAEAVPPHPVNFNSGERVSDAAISAERCGPELSFKQYVNLIFAFRDVFDDIEPPALGNERQLLNDPNTNYRSTDDEGNVV